jgi:hypothetical protein
LRHRLSCLSLACALGTALLAGCTSRGGDQVPIEGSEAAFVAEVANYQLLADRPNRFLVGLFGRDDRWVSFGGARLRFIGPDGGTPPELADVDADFLALPGTPDSDGRSPTLTLAADGRGVYAARNVTFPDPGVWEVEVSVELDGTTKTANDAFEVIAEPVVPAVGDQAPATDHPVLGDDVDPGTLDSRARDGDALPDPELHELSIADAVEAHRPAVVVFSTPVYCVSRFCGPITDMVADLAADYADRAAFIHVEIWSDFESRTLNPAARVWLQASDGQAREPWTFLIGADGKIAGSWDNVATRGEIEPLLRELPDR